MAGCNQTTEMSAFEKDTRRRQAQESKWEGNGKENAFVSRDNTGNDDHAQSVVTTDIHGLFRTADECVVDTYPVVERRSVGRWSL
jgi:hypothetical protein